MAHKQNIAPQICRFPADLSRVQWAIDHFFRPLLPVVSIKKLSSDPWNGAHGGSRQLELGQRRVVDFTVRYIAENVFLPYGHRGSNKYSWYFTTQQNCNEGVLFKRFTLWTLRHFLHSFQVGLLKDDLTGGVQVRYSYYRYEIFSSGNTSRLVTAEMLAGVKRAVPWSRPTVRVVRADSSVWQIATSARGKRLFWVGRICLRNGKTLHKLQPTSCLSGFAASKRVTCAVSHITNRLH